jgi:hypothetical protein
MVHVKDLLPDQKLAVESILGYSLREDECLTIRPANVIREAPTGTERTLRFQQYLDSLDSLADRLQDFPEDEVEAALDEATDFVRHQTV